MRWDFNSSGETTTASNLIEYTGCPNNVNKFGKEYRSSEVR